MKTREELLAFVTADPALARIAAEVRAREDGDPGHDLAHALRVAASTIGIGGAEVDRREAVAAALLHDVVNVPKDSPERARASELSAGVARELLSSLGFTAAAVERIAEAIRDHSYSRGAEPTSALGRALQDADRLEALGALGIFRTASCGARMGARYFDPDDPWAERRALDDARFTVDHFFTKLLHLEKTMRTEAGSAEARRRARTLRAFLEALADEIGVPLERSRLAPREP